MLGTYLPVLFRNYHFCHTIEHVKLNGNFFHGMCKAYKYRVISPSLRLVNPTNLKFHGHRYNFSFSELCKKKVLINVINVQIIPKRHLHPIFWVVLRPLLKFAAVLTGRGFRKWWQNLPPNKKEYFLDVLRKNSVKITGIVSFLVLLAFMYYLSHIEEAPITKRKRFMAFNLKQFKQIGEIEYKKICLEFDSLFLPPSHPATKRVATVVHQLLGANKDIKEIYDKSWTIAVVDDETENAFVLPNGEIFVFGGMLKLCANNDQLGAVLAHEMSHCILGHAAENFSVAHLLDCIMIVVITAVWAIVPSDFLALFTHWLMKQLVDIMLQLPYSRKIETEADEVGLTLAAKACFDVRESSAFWSKMAFLQKDIKEIPNIEFLSTHPSHEKRSNHLDNLMIEALKVRTACGCPQLTSMDPRLNIDVLARKLDEERRKYKVYKPVIVTIPN